MTEEPIEEEFEQPPLDRPLECSECKKPITVQYTEMEKSSCTHTGMCSDCPELQRHLKGVPSLGHPHKVMGIEAGLTCGDCGTTLELVRTGHRLGCSHCYEVFSNAIIQELQARHKLPPHAKAHRKSIPLHIGRAPGEVAKVNPSLQLIALNEALSEMLKREDYEQAAMIRDQINALTQQETQEKADDNK